MRLLSGTKAGPAPEAASPDKETPAAPQEGELWAPKLQPPLQHEQVIWLLTWTMSKTSGSKELPIKPKGATEMGKALVASKCQARGLQPSHGSHANLVAILVY